MAPSSPNDAQEIQETSFAEEENDTDDVSDDSYHDDFFPAEEEMEEEEEMRKGKEKKKKKKSTQEGRKVSKPGGKSKSSSSAAPPAVQDFELQELVEIAARAAGVRVIVKRPKHTETVQKISHSLKTQREIRYDVRSGLNQAAKSHPSQRRGPKFKIFWSILIHTLPGKKKDIASQPAK